MKSSLPVWKCVLVTQSCSILCDPMDYNSPGSSVHGISQARILEWVATSFSRGSSWPRNWTPVSCNAGRLFTGWAPEKAYYWWRFMVRRQEQNLFWPEDSPCPSRDSHRTKAGWDGRKGGWKTGVLQPGSQSCPNTSLSSPSPVGFPGGLCAPGRWPISSLRATINVLELEGSRDPVSAVTGATGQGVILQLELEKLQELLST